MTSRKFKYRKKDHVADIKFNRKTTALARLHQEEIIHINFNESKIIFPSNQYYPSGIRETIEILKRKNNVSNDTASSNLTKLWLEVFNDFENRNKHYNILLTT